MHSLISSSISMTYVMLISTSLVTQSANGSSMSDKNEPGNVKNATAQLYVEQIGVMEFSGQMIAKPKQQQDGINDYHYQMARQRLDIWLLEYVAATDEIIFEVPAGLTENDMADYLLATGDYEYVEPNWIVYPLDCPNDSRFGSQWHHDKMQSCLGWDITTGRTTISVGVCDTGVRTTHEDLLDNRLEGYNAVDKLWESEGGAVNDINGHGTLTTGSAAAQGNNSVGVSGMGWTLSHRMLRVTNDSSGGAYFNHITAAARMAIDSGDKVASVSYSGVSGMSSESAGKYIKNHGGLLVWAAGNDGADLSVDHENVIVVGATTSSDTKASWSNYGRIIDVVAPGVDIYTTSNGGNSSYGAASGTSLACPLAAGAVAMIWARNPALTPVEVENILFNSCDDLGSPGEDDTYGHGRINLYNALAAVDKLYLEVLPGILYSKETIEFNVSVGDPATDTGILYSIAGEGSTFINQLGVTVDLESALMVGNTKTSDASGEAQWILTLPNVKRPTLVWFQAAQSSGKLSNIHLTQVNPAR